MSTQVTVVGTVATDPRHIVTQAGAALCSFRLASDERRYDRAQQKWVEGETNWYGVSVFRALGENAHRSLRKGERIIVNGRLRVRRWESDGKAGTSVEIDADALGHDLRWGVSSFDRNPSPGDAITGRPAASEPTTDSFDDAFVPVDFDRASPFESAGGTEAGSDDGASDREPSIEASARVA